MSSAQDLLAALAANKPLGESFKGVDFTGIKVPSKASFKGAFLRYAKFANASLKGADFRDANLRHVDFSGANLEGARFDGADVGKADFAGASVMGASLMLAENLDTALGINRSVMFFPHQQIEELIAEKDTMVEFDGKHLRVPELEGVYALVEAYRVVSAIDGKDEKKIVGKILTMADWKKLGAEVYPETALVGEIGYQLVHGFLGTVEAAAAAAVVPQAAAAPAPAAPRREVIAPGKASAPAPAAPKPKSDLDLLNEFLLGSLDK